ncbi:MAG: EthD family reductase [Acidimicrobiia bacterium]|nr:EthD family reductase [Acidimicrobiia bacterium]
MIKVLTWFSRKPDMSLDDFRTYWREEHPRTVLVLPGLRAYNQNPTTDAGYTKGEPYCDGVAETWWDDLDALRAHRGTPEIEALMDDEDAFIDPNRRRQLLVREVVIKDGQPPEGALKQFTWMKRRPDLSVEEAQAYWRDRHGPLAAAVPGMVRYVQNHTSAEQYRNAREPEFDGVPVVYFSDLETARAAAASDELAATRADEPNFVAPGSLPWVVTDEIRIL